VAALSAKLTHLHSNSRDPCSCTRNHHSDSRPTSRDDATPTLCWHHHCYRVWAQKCTQPCSYYQQEKLTQRTSTATHVCATTTNCLFITDRLSNANSWSTRVQTSPYTPAGSFQDAKNATTTTSARLMALPSPPLDGCPSAST
jgi:hypothetical protein